MDMQRIISKHQHTDGLIALFPQHQMSGDISYDFGPYQGHGTHHNVSSRYDSHSVSKGHFMNASGYDAKSGAYTDILTASLIANFNGDAGAAFVFVKTDKSWNELANRYALYLETDSDNLIFMRKDAAAGKIYYRHRAAGTGLSLDIEGMTTTDWFCMSMMWNQAGAEMRTFLDGVHDSTGVNPDPWEGGDLTSAIIGAETDAPDDPWSGGIGLVAIYNTIKTDAEMLYLSKP